MFYSKSTGGFYDREIHGDNIPADAVEITVEEYQALLEGQSQGKRIVADENGYPVLQEQMFYSKSTGGFYTREIHGDNIPADAVDITVEEHQALLEGQSLGKRIVADENGYPVLQDPPPPTAEQIIAQYEARVQRWLDEQAQALGYDDIKSAVTYADEPAVTKFQQEGQALRRLRSLVWARCYEILDEVKAGQRPIPTEEELIAEMEAIAEQAP